MTRHGPIQLRRLKVPGIFAATLRSPNETAIDRTSIQFGANRRPRHPMQYRRGTARFPSNINRLSFLSGPVCWNSKRQLSSIFRSRNNLHWDFHLAVKWW